MPIPVYNYKPHTASVYTSMVHVISYSCMLYRIQYTVMYHVSVSLHKEYANDIKRHKIQFRWFILISSLALFGELPSAIFFFANSNVIT